MYQSHNNYQKDYANQRLNKVAVGLFQQLHHKLFTSFVSTKSNLQIMALINNTTEKI